MNEPHHIAKKLAKKLTIAQEKQQYYHNLIVTIERNF
jgi:hypothetical protein